MQVICDAGPRGINCQELWKIVEKVQNPSHEFELIIGPRTKSMFWRLDIDTAALDRLSASISKRYTEFKDSPLSFTFTWGIDYPNTETNHRRIRNSGVSSAV